MIIQGVKINMTMFNDYTGCQTKRDNIKSSFNT